MNGHTLKADTKNRTWRPLEILFFVVSLTLSFQPLLAGEVARLEPVMITAKALADADNSSARGGINLARKIQYHQNLKTPITDQTLDSIKNVQQLSDVLLELFDTNGWKTNTSDYLRFGFNQKAIWLKTHIINQTNTPVSVLLEMGYPMLDEVLILETVQNKLTNWSIRGDSIAHRGASQPLRPSAHAPDTEIHPTATAMLDPNALTLHASKNSTTQFTHTMSLPAGEQKTVFIYIRTDGLLTIPIFLHETSAYMRVTRYDSHLQGLIMALLFTGMLLGVIFAYAQVQRTDVWLSTFFASLAGIQLIISGSTQHLLPVKHQMLLNLLLPSLLITSALSITLFATYFLKLPRIAPRLAHIIPRASMMSLGLLPLTATLPYSYAIQCALVLQQSLFIFVLLLSLFALKQKHLVATFFTLAWFTFCIGDVLYLFNDIGIFPHSYTASLIWTITLTAMITCCGLAFAETTRQFDQELKLRQRESNKVLQREVARRTAELNAMTNSALDASAEAMRSKEIAEAANNAKSEFLAVMSHEIRTPINGVLGMTELLKDTSLNDQQQHYLQTIHSSGRNLLTILDDVLDLGKIESKHMSLQERAFALDDLIEDTFSVFTEYTRSNTVPLYLFMDGRLPTTIYGDPVRLQQVLVNLISNAFKFTQSGHIGLMLSLDLEDPTEPAIKFSVSDTGIGVDPQQRDKLFAPFSQVDATTSRRYGGTGLGLAICERLIQLMDGQIDVERNQAGGSTFWFRIPLTQSLDTSETEHATLASFARTQFDHVSVILQVQDPFLERSLIQIFSQINITPYITHCTAETLKYLRELPNQSAGPNLLMLDNDALDQSFADFHAMLTSLGEHRPQNICVLSTLDTIHKAAETLRQIQSVSYIDKPITLKRLAAHLSSRLPTQATPEHRENIQESPWQGLRIMVAEDNRVNQLVIKGMLKKMGIKPDIVENGQEAIDAYCANPDSFDLIFMDCEMPDKDGFAATKEIRNYETNCTKPNIPIIALTAHALPEHVQRCLSVGMNAHIAKPVNREKLESCFQTYFPIRSIA